MGLRRYFEKWDRANEFAVEVARCVERAIHAEGLTPMEIGGQALEDAVTRKEFPLRMSQLEQVACRLNRHPSSWLKKAS